jgi:hypothetical protein
MVTIETPVRIGREIAVHRRFLAVGEAKKARDVLPVRRGAGA